MSHCLTEETSTCIQLLKDLRIPLGTITAIVPDTRSRSRWGVCRKDPDGSFRISVSARLLQDDVPLRSLRETILHELLHTAPGCMNHTGDWKRYAHTVNSALGLNIRRVSTREEIGISAEGTARYRLVCCGCGAVHIRYRASKFILHPERYRCAVCGGSFRHSGGEKPTVQAHMLRLRRRSGPVSSQQVCSPPRAVPLCSLRRKLSAHTLTSGGFILYDHLFCDHFAQNILSIFGRCNMSPPLTLAPKSDKLSKYITNAMTKPSTHLILFSESCRSV